MTLAEVDDIVNYRDSNKLPNYLINNLELEYSCIYSDYLTNEAKRAYEVGKGLFDENILLRKTFTISKPNDSVINEHINIPRRSMSGLLFLFTENQTAGMRDSEKFINPDIKPVYINTDGIANSIYSKGMMPADLWNSINQRMNEISNKKPNLIEKEFYTNDKFALWIDFRTNEGNKIGRAHV